MAEMIRSDETLENAFGVLVDCCEICIKEGVRPPLEAIRALLSIAHVHGGVSQYEVNKMAFFLVSLPGGGKGEQCLGRC